MGFFCIILLLSAYNLIFSFANWLTVLSYDWLPCWSSVFSQEHLPESLEFRITAKCLYSPKIIISDDVILHPNGFPGPKACFFNVPKLFGWHKSLCIFNKKTFQALKLGSFFAFLYIWNILKEQLFTASGSQFLELLFGTDKLAGLSINGPLQICSKIFRIRASDSWLGLMHSTTETPYPQTDTTWLSVMRVVQVYRRNQVSYAANRNENVPI